MRLRCRALALFVTLTFAFPPLLLNAQGEDSDSEKTDLVRRLELLEKEVGELRALLGKSGPADAGSAAAAEPLAQEDSLSRLLGSTRMSGFVDAYYGYNVNQPQSRASLLRSFDAPANQFALNMVELVIDRPAEATNGRLGYHIGLGFGNAMNAVNASDPGGLGFAQYLKEAYFSYLAPAGSGLAIDVGKFVTPHGFEVIESKDNWNYSRGLLFSYAIPYYHFGVRAKYAFSSKYSLTGYMVNGWNNVVDNNSGKSVGVTFAWTPNNKFGFIQNYMAGPELAGTNRHWRQLSDTVITYAPLERLLFAVNYDYGRGDVPSGATRPVFWTGFGGYVRYLLSSQSSVAARYEYYNDHDGFTTGTRQHLNEITATVERVLARRLITRLEFRHDVSNSPVFLKGSTPALGQSTVTAGMIYVFDSREP